jgi:hypothetical protein
MEAHNANTNLVQPNFYEGDYVLRAVPKMRQHKLSLTWKGPYVVEKVYANRTLRLRSLIQDVTFITHITRARIYQCRPRHTPGDVGHEAHRRAQPVNPLRHIPVWTVEKKTGDMFIFTEWVGFDSEEGTMEPLYEQWVDVPRLLTEHLQARADAGDELAHKALIKISEFENDQGDHSPHTMGDTNTPNKVCQKLLREPIHPNHPY